MKRIFVIGLSVIALSLVLGCGAGKKCGTCPQWSLEIFK